jgi:hypothetical protein
VQPKKMEPARSVSKSSQTARPRRRGDRIESRFAAIAHSRLWHKADIPTCLLFVCFWGKADISKRLLSDLVALEPKWTPEQSFLLVLPNDFPEIVGGAQTSCSIIIGIGDGGMSMV